MRLSGSTGLDQSINYTGKIAIPQSLGKVSQLGTVDMNIGGTFTSPKVSIDMESLAKKAATNAIEKAGEKLVDKLLGGSTTKTEATDSTATEEKKDVKEQLLNKAINLLKKK